MTNKEYVILRRKILDTILKTKENCWIWQGAKDKEGYALSIRQISGKTRNLRMHRVSLIVFKNKYELLTDKKLYACHTCENKACVNPHHLFVGDWLENNMDSVLRSPNVNKEFMTKITEMYRKKHNIPKNVVIKRLWVET